MATVTRQDQQTAEVTVVRGVPFRAYLRMVRHPENSHLRMVYYDGTLEIVSPIFFAHEWSSRRFSMIVLAVARSLGLRMSGTGGLTIARSGDEPTKGVGKEPDQAFYLHSRDRVPWNRKLDLNAGDSPPDLWIEVDHRASSRGRFPVYARLGVPEVWQYRVERKSIKFFQLVEETYLPLEHSLALPVLTPARVLEMMQAGEAMEETDFLTFLEAWVPAMIARAANEPTPE